jgi:hypothetical protein
VINHVVKVGEAGLLALVLRMTIDTVHAVDVTVGVTIDAIGVAVGVAICECCSLGIFLAIAGVSIVESKEISSNGERTVDDWVLGVEAWLEEVVGVGHEGTMSGCRPSVYGEIIRREY